MIPFKIDDKTVQVPTSWSDVTLRQFLTMRENSDTLDIISIFTGIEKDRLMNCSDVDIDDKILPCIKFLATDPKLNEIPVPDSITINEWKYDIPADLGFKTFGQKVALQTKMQKVQDINEIIPYALAVYFCQGNYDEKKIQEFADTMDVKLVEAYPVAAFFLKRLTDCASKNLQSLNQNMKQKKSEQGLIGLNDLDW